MNTLVQEYLASTNDFHIHGEPGFSGYADLSCETKEAYVPTNESSPVDGSSSSSEGPISIENDHSDAILKFISEMLMEEEDLRNKPCMLHHCLALQATEKSLYDAINTNHSDVHFIKTSSGSSSDVTNNWSCNIGDFESLSTYPEVQSFSFGSSQDIGDAADKQQVSPIGHFDPMSRATKRDISPLSFYEFLGHDTEPKNRNARDRSLNRSGVNKNRYREDNDVTKEQHRSNKHIANNINDVEPLEMYDQVLLCSYPEGVMQTSGGETEQIHAKKKSSQPSKQGKGVSDKGRSRGGDKKQGVVIKEVVDLRTLLMQCAQAVAIFDRTTVNNLLLRIREHSSPQGDGTERAAYYFANALEARLTGNGTELYAAINSKRISAAEILKAYKMYITACPFKKMSNSFANRTIVKLASGATTLHIIDFGILYGYQWPCLIQALSERPGGPPKLRITGIDFPQPGFRPAERIEDTGRRLAKYCERFRVPFEYNAIAQKWEMIKVEDVKINKNELVVVNSLYRLHNVLDETVMVNSPRDGVLNLIKKINPDMFIHGVTNGTFNAPFFVTRFKEAFYHYSSMFDMFEVTIPHHDENRLLFEEHIFGKEVMNIIACEGTERIERPETYKQWQVRNVRAGFKQIPLDQETLKYLRSKVKTDYHKDFLVDEHGKWMLHGWKGRIIHSISCWQPAHN